MANKKENLLNYLITGGSGSIGQELVRQLQPTLMEPDKIIIYSRDEAKQATMRQTYPEGGKSGLRYFVGDICDYDRLAYAMRDVDICIHAAAMKRIDTCEYEPLESIRVNVQGSVNVAKACDDAGVEKAFFLSTDKACLPISAYGAQKAVVEHLWQGMNNFSECRYSVIRYGNVIGSKGSVFQAWDGIPSGGIITLTDARMTRFLWKIGDAAAFIIRVIGESIGRGCIYVPKMNRHAMSDMARIYTDNIAVTGLRCPEKLHEDLISVHEAPWARDLGDYYVIYPGFHNWADGVEAKGDPLPEGFSVSSEKGVPNV
jgi:UDP-N-acetylglucosamine 4,6-dehydratase/5-epimerase